MEEDKYKEALERAREIYFNKEYKPNEAALVKETLAELFPELGESDDEIIRKAIIRILKGETGYTSKEDTDKYVAWLEKQDKFDKSLYIRFGDIPTNGKSKIYNGEIETGIEEGISVYPAFEDKEGNIILGLSLPITKTSLHTQQHLLEYDNRPCYLVSGDYLGKGTDGEPIIKNVRIIKEIKPYRIKQDKENNTYVINNTPNCGISVYNEELKDSEDEKIRKQLLDLVHRYTLAPYSDRDRWVAYLEKVKDFDEELSKSYKQGYGKGYVDGMVAAKKKELEKQAAIKDGNSIDPQFAKPITTTETKYPKFKIGDWVVDEEDNHVYQVKRVVTNVSSGMSGYDLSDGGYFYSTKTNCHLWSIADAQDGDILSNGKMIVIFKHLEEPSYRQHIVAYIGLDNSGHIQVTDGHWELGIDKAKPATKEQCELLFRKMEEDGYFWNSVTKELSQISVTKKSDKVWNEDDEKNLQGVIDEIQANKSSAPEYDLKTYDKFLSWLKSIKDRIQPKPKQVGWSEEDESKIIDSIYEAINVYYLNYPFVLSQIKDWLKIKQRLS